MWKEEKCLWDVNSSLCKSRLEKAKSFKKLADQVEAIMCIFFIYRQQNLLFCISLISYFFRNLVFLFLSRSRNQIEKSTSSDHNFWKSCPSVAISAKISRNNSKFSGVILRNMLYSSSSSTPSSVGGVSYWPRLPHLRSDGFVFFSVFCFLLIAIAKPTTATNMWRLKYLRSELRICLRENQDKEKESF